MIIDTDKVTPTPGATDFVIPGAWSTCPCCNGSGWAVRPPFGLSIDGCRTFWPKTIADCICKKCCGHGKVYHPGYTCKLTQTNATPEEGTMTAAAAT